LDLIFSIFQAYTTVKEATQAYGSVSDWVINVVGNWSRKNPIETVDPQIERVGRATEADIRKVAAQVFGGDSKGSDREILTATLVNMARNVRNRQSLGTMDGSFFRDAQSLARLLTENIEPVRHRGEPVAAGSPWVLKRHLGMGSFGEVWMAENPDYPIPRAYKFFTRDGSGEWLAREQQALSAKLKRLGQHQHIVEFEDVQVAGCKHPYLALEYCGGGSLEEWIIKGKDRRPAIEPGEIIRQVVSGLAAAHSEGITHRDIKPANILLTSGPDVRIKIGDFGLARVTASTRDAASPMASLAGVVGTSLYLPPESQQRGVRHKPAQDDVFALGVVWYQLIVGAIERPPYDFADRLRSKGLDSHTIGLIERCLAHPGRRFADARAVEDAMTADEVPVVAPCPAGMPDVQHLVIEYLSTLAR